MMLNADELLKFLDEDQLYKGKFGFEGGAFHVVCDIPTGRLLAATRHVHTADKLSYNTLNSHVCVLANRAQIDLDFDTNRPYYHRVEDIRIERISSPLSDKDLYDSALVAEKALALDFILSTTSDIKLRSYANGLLQYQIYDLKLKEANDIITSGIDSIDDEVQLKYPFVASYALLEELSLQTAAREVQLRHEFFYTKMAAVESLRMRFNKRVIECTDIRDVPLAIQEFLAEAGLYAQV